MAKDNKVAIKSLDVTVLWIIPPCVRREMTMRRTEFHVPRASSSNYRHCTSTSWLLLSTYVSRIGITTMGIMWLMITAINHGHPYKSTERERERQCHNNVHHAVTLLLLRLLLLLYPMNCTYPGITSCTLCLYCDTQRMEPPAGIRIPVAGSVIVVLCRCCFFNYNQITLIRTDIYQQIILLQLWLWNCFLLCTEELLP